MSGRYFLRRPTSIPTSCLSKMWNPSLQLHWRNIKAAIFWPAWNLFPKNKVLIVIWLLALNLFPLNNPTTAFPCKNQGITQPDCKLRWANLRKINTTFRYRNRRWRLREDRLPSLSLISAWKGRRTCFRGEAFLKRKRRTVLLSQGCRPGSQLLQKWPRYLQKNE